MKYLKIAAFASIAALVSGCTVTASPGYHAPGYYSPRPVVVAPAPV